MVAAQRSSSAAAKMSRPLLSTSSVYVAHHHHQQRSSSLSLLSSYFVRRWRLLTLLFLGVVVTMIMTHPMVNSASGSYQSSSMLLFRNLATTINAIVQPPEPPAPMIWNVKNLLSSSSTATTMTSPPPPPRPKQEFHFQTTARPCTRTTTDDADRKFLQEYSCSSAGEDRHLLEYYYDGTTTSSVSLSGKEGGRTGRDLPPQRWCGGTYLELGALDGVAFSNTHLFHFAYGWQGVLIELDPESYDQLVLNRPNELVTPIHAAVCNTEQTVHYIPQQLGWTIGATSGIWEFMPESFRAMWWKEIQLENTVPIRCTPLRQLLVESTPHIHFFDFFSLDVEGAELEVSQSIDYAATAFGVIVVEADQHNVRKNYAVRLLLQQQGYLFVEEWGKSYWFVHPNFDTIYNTTDRDTSSSSLYSK